jgi:hypothetical protein
MPSLCVFALGVVAVVVVVALKLGHRVHQPQQLELVVEQEQVYFLLHVFCHLKSM